MYEPKPLSLTKIQAEILLHIAKHKQANKYEISQSLNKSYSSIYNGINCLLEHKLVKVQRTEPGEKNPKIEVDYYALTLSGLLVTFDYTPTWNYIDQIAEKQADKLPLIFGKWQFFINKGVRDKVAKRFEGAVLSELWNLTKETIRFVESEETKKGIEIFRKEKMTSVLDLERTLTVNTLMFSYVWPPSFKLEKYYDEELEWTKILMQDSDLADFWFKEAEELLDLYKGYVHNIESWMAWAKNHQKV